MADIYFSGQGSLYSSDRDAGGNPTAFRDLGNVPMLKITLETDNLEHKESRTGNRLTDLRLTKERRSKITMTLENFSRANLTMLLFGTYTLTTGGSASNELLPNPVAVGDSVALLHQLITGLTVVDSTGSPITLTLGTNYTADLNGGMITIKSLGALVQPFKASYTYPATDTVAIYKGTTKERFLKFVGLNTANSNKTAMVELYRVMLDPVGQLDLINDELMSLEIQGSVLYDSARDADPTLGGFGKITLAP